MGWIEMPPSGNLRKAIDDLAEAIKYTDPMRPILGVVALDAGTITVTDGVHIYEKEVEKNKQVNFRIEALGTFDVILSYNGLSISRSIEITELNDKGIYFKWIDTL